MFVFAQDYVGIPQGTVRATVLIETITAAYEMEEILYELRDHASGLNAGRWDYLFSIVKNFRDGGAQVRPAGPQRGDDDGPVHARVHRTARPHLPQARRARDRRHGGLHPLPPRRRGQQGRLREGQGRQGPRGRATASTAPGSPTPTWSRSPAPPSTRSSATGPNQKDRLREDVHVSAADLIAIDSLDAKPTYEGLRNAVQVGIRYIEAWLRGLGAVAIFNLMEDAATAEISRSQIWQWINAGVVFEQRRDRPPPDLVREVAAEELAAIRAEIGEEAFAAGHWQQAHDLLLTGRARRGLRGLPDAAGVRTAQLRPAVPSPGPAAGGRNDLPRPPGKDGQRTCGR